MAIDPGMIADQRLDAVHEAIREEIRRSPADGVLSLLAEQCGLVAASAMRVVRLGPNGPARPDGSGTVVDLLHDLTLLGIVVQEIKRRANACERPDDWLREAWEIQAKKSHFPGGSVPPSQAH